MRRNGIAILFGALLVLAIVPLVQSQETKKKGHYKWRSVGQLEKLIAPIALAPDPILDDVLEASLQPDDVVEAGEYVNRHHGSKMEMNPDWSDALKRLLRYPHLIGQMDGHLAYVARIGNAQENQAKGMRDAINRFRRKAMEAGNLASNAHQTVEKNGVTVTITPTDPDDIYLPYYDEQAVYYPRRGQAPMVAYFSVNSRRPEDSDDDYRDGVNVGDRKDPLKRKGYRNSGPYPGYSYAPSPLPTNAYAGRPNYPTASNVYGGGTWNNNVATSPYQKPGGVVNPYQQPQRQYYPYPTPYRSKSPYNPR